MGDGRSDMARPLGKRARPRADGERLERNADARGDGDDPRVARRLSALGSRFLLPANESGRVSQAQLKQKKGPRGLPAGLQYFIPETSYFPTQLPAQYHRRCGA